VFVNFQCFSALSCIAPDKPLIDSIASEDNSALVHFVSSEHSPPRNPGTDFYVEYADEDNAGCVSFCVTLWTCVESVIIKIPALMSTV